MIPGDDREVSLEGARQLILAPRPELAALLSPDDPLLKSRGIRTARSHPPLR